MSYSTIKAAALVQLRLVSNFSAANVSFADWNIVNAGHDRAMVVTLDSFENNPVTYGWMQTTWRFQIHLLEKAVPDAAGIEARFEADIVALMTRINSYPELGGAAITARVARGQDTAELLEFGGAKYCHWGIWLEADERLDASYQE